ncbi:MAG: trypsin-like peptidase domain-containing protein [bacterium]
MSTRSVIAAILLIGLGIVFGVTLISSFKGVDLSFAGEDVRLGAQTQEKTPHPALKELNEAFNAIGKEVTPTVVFITTESEVSTGSADRNNPMYRFFDLPTPPEKQKQVGSGSGFLITGDGYILTNNHVVENATANGIEVQLSDHRIFKKAKVVGTDKTTDIAVIKIDAKDLPMPRLGNSDQLEVGHMVFAMGNPGFGGSLMLLSSMTQGIVSALGRQLRIIEDNSGLAIEDFIQTDAVVNRGNSGGPLVNINGEVIGINTAIATSTGYYQGYSFAIPINLAKRVAMDIIKYGRFKRGFLGVQIQTVDAAKAKAIGLDRPKGVLIYSVTSDGSAEKAGVKEGDVILAVDGAEVNANNQLQRLIALKSPGETVTLRIFRDGKTIEKRVTLKENVSVQNTASNDETDRQADRERKSNEVEKAKSDLLGISMKNIDSKIKKEYQIEQGVLIESVDRLGAAAAEGIRPNDVLISLDRQPATSVTQVNDILKKKKPGDSLLMRIKSADKSIKFIAMEIPEKE